MAWRYLPNALTILRMVLMAPFVWWMHTGHTGLALAVFLTAAATDFLDGVLARRFEWRTRLGSILDPLADKWVMVTSFLLLGSLGALPLWLVALALLRDGIVVLAVTGWWRLSGQLEGNPTGVGKLSTALAMVLIVVALVGLQWPILPERLGEALQWLFAMTTVVSCIQYLRMGWVAWRHRAEAS